MDPEEPWRGRTSIPPSTTRPPGPSRGGRGSVSSRTDPLPRPAAIGRFGGGRRHLVQPLAVLRRRRQLFGDEITPARGQVPCLVRGAARGRGAPAAAARAPARER